MAVRRNAGEPRWWPLLPREAEMSLPPVPRAPAWRTGQMALPTPGGSSLGTPSHCPQTCPAQPWLPSTHLQRTRGPDFQDPYPLRAPGETARVPEVTAGGGPSPQLPRPQPTSCSPTAKAPEIHKLYKLLLWNQPCFQEVPGPRRTPSPGALRSLGTCMGSLAHITQRVRQGEAPHPHCTYESASSPL